MIASITYSTYSVTSAGKEFLDKMLLPGTKVVKETKTGESSIRSKGSRNGKGSHALKVVQDLISNKKKWFIIEDSEDYNFPGVFTHPYPQRRGFCEDISKLPNYDVTDPHFIFTDI